MDRINRIRNKDIGDNAVDAQGGETMERSMMRPPGFPFVPFLFPMGVALFLLGVSAWYSYMNWKELEAIRQVEASRAPRAEMPSGRGDFRGSGI